MSNKEFDFIVGKIPQISVAELNAILEAKKGIYSVPLEKWVEENGFLNIYTSRFKLYINDVKSNIYFDQSRIIDYGVVNSTDINAFAYATESSSPQKLDFIGINFGIFYTLSDIFCRIMSHPENFIDIGDPSLEDKKQSIITDLYTDIIRARLKPAIPACKTRLGFAMELTHLAIDFLFNHELAHIRNGHLDYVREVFSSNHWSETASVKVDPIIQQTLEWDADCGGVAMMLSFVFGTSDKLQGNLEKAGKAFKLLYGSRLSGLDALFFAMYIVFRIFNVEWAYQAQGTQKSPLPASRMYTLIQFITAILEGNKFKKEMNAFLIRCPKMLVDAEKTIANIQNTEIDLSMFSSVANLSATHQEYQEKLKDCWKTIRPDLDRHKRGGSLAPI